MTVEKQIAEIINLVWSGKFDEATALINDVPFDKLRSALSLKTQEDGNLAAYGFYNALLLKSPQARFHYAASDLLCMSLTTYPGAYTVAYYHACQAARIEPKEIFYKEFLLFFYNNPEDLMSREEGEIIAKEILAMDPGNEMASAILKAGK